MTKDEIQVDDYLIHSDRGVVRFTEQCKILEKENSDPTTLFVDDFGQILKVPMSCIEGKASWRNTQT